MPRLFFVDTRETIGEITDEQLQFLQDQLEEEFEGDVEYYISRDTLDVLRDSGADEALMGLLEQALGDREDVDVGWE